jgi:hypothetical protein
LVAQVVHGADRGLLRIPKSTAFLITDPRLLTVTYFHSALA